MNHVIRYTEDTRQIVHVISYIVACWPLRDAAAILDSRIDIFSIFYEIAPRQMPQDLPDY